MTDRIREIAVLAGDGIGPEVMRQGLRVLQAVTEKYGYAFNLSSALIGGAAIAKTGSPLPPETLELCDGADAVLLGAVGLPEYDQDPNITVRPEQGLLGLRKALQLYLNIRPVTIFPSMVEQSVLKPQVLNDVDFVIYRELSSGIYFGEKHEASETSPNASDLCAYTSEEIHRVVTRAFAAAESRRGQLCLVDKANVLATSRLWRQVTMRLAADHPAVTVDYMYVDNAAMQLVLNPRQFDVIVTSNMFGDILSDLASAIVGSIGLLPSASIGTGTALFEPVHGSYPQAAGKDIANPLAMILSVAMMLEHLGLSDAAADVREAVRRCTDKGIGTSDMHPEHECGCSKMGELIAHMVADEDFRLNVGKKGAISDTII
ncbi:MAG: 3-isopropylmalate dehydrogenase [Saprospiraceae bacterium]|nr:3-isopropylmalate dehydrogenase [Saprospiraceae bacterium]